MDRPGGTVLVIRESVGGGPAIQRRSVSVLSDRTGMINRKLSLPVARVTGDLDDRRLVSPWRTGLLYCLAVFVPVVTFTSIKLAVFPFPVHVVWRWLLAVVELLVATCFGYVLLGSRVGLEKARAPVMLLFGLGAAGLIYLVIQQFGAGR